MESGWQKVIYRSCEIEYINSKYSTSLLTIYYVYYLKLYDRRSRYLGRKKWEGKFYLGPQYSYF